MTTPSKATPTWVKLVLPLLLGLLAALAVWFILPMMWYGCDVEHLDAGPRFARGVTIILAVPTAFVVTTVATSVTFSLMPTHQKSAPYAAVLVAVVVVLVSITVIHDPNHQAPNPKCPNGAPPWSRLLG